MCDSRCSCWLCCGLRHALRRSLFVVACCLSNGKLHQQWACISVGMGCLGNGGCPSPTEHLRPSARDSLKSRFCSSHWVFQSLQSPGLAYRPSLVQSQVQPSQVSGCRFNRAPGQARPVGSAGWGRPSPPPLPTSLGRGTAWRPASPLYLGVSRSVGNKDQSGNAALTHLSTNSTRASILGCSHCTILSPPCPLFFLPFSKHRKACSPWPIRLTFKIKAIPRITAISSPSF